MEASNKPIEEISDLLDDLGTRGELAPICLSTIGHDGMPNSRFVDLKKVADGRLFFGTDSRSTKAKEFDQRNEVSLCAWWSSLQIQVRVRGTIDKATLAASDSEFAKRNPTAKAIASTSVQSHEIVGLDDLRKKVHEVLSASAGEIPRPSTWWMYSVLPVEIEILRFSEDRIHVRKEYRKVGEGWMERMLSP